MCQAGNFWTLLRSFSCSRHVPFCVPNFTLKILTSLKEYYGLHNIDWYNFYFVSIQLHVSASGLRKLAYRNTHYKMTTDGNSKDCLSFVQNIKFITIKSPLCHVRQFIYRPEDGLIFEVQTCSRMIEKLKVYKAM